MLDIFDKMEKRFTQASKDVKQLAGSSGWRSTVIVHPQLSKSNDEAQELDKNWKMREEKQLMDNVKKALS